jgi:hypothetical protein
MSPIHHHGMWFPSAIRTKLNVLRNTPTASIDQRATTTAIRRTSNARGILARHVLR